MEDMIARMFVAALGVLLGLAGYLGLLGAMSATRPKNKHDLAACACLAIACIVFAIGCAWLFVHSAMRL